MYRRRQPDHWAKRPRLYANLGRSILERGEPLLAFDLFQEGLASSPKDPELLRLLALSLARSGAPRRACDILTRLYRQGQRDEETSGMLARTHKDLAALAANPGECDKERRLAFGFYFDSYRKQGGYYAGINAATLALQLGRHNRARGLARQVLDRCLRLTGRRAGTQDYWLAATVGEGNLVLGDDRQAEFWYHRATRLAGGRYADLGSTRRQARLILRSLGKDASCLQRWLRIPAVVSFTGHRIDSPSRDRPRFPHSAERAVRAEIARRLETLDAGFGFSSAASGADILFIEAMLERGGEVHVVLPCNPHEFRGESVDPAGPRWGRRFDTVLRQAVSVYVANERGKTPGSLGYVYANLLTDGLARLKASSLDAEMKPMAVWDGEREAGPGGTGSLVRHWRSQGFKPEIISPCRKRARATGRRPAKPSRETQQIKALLFADVAGYGRLKEEQIPAFVTRFMRVPGRLLKTWPAPPEAKATWGDALHLVFGDVGSAGRFALELSDRVRSVRWAELGLPPNLSFRISLHAGPVYRIIDPVTLRPSVTGAHVTCGARIEPVAPPGQIYASQAFAALAASQKAAGFICEYVGAVPLAKGFGTWPLYHLRRVRGL